MANLITDGFDWFPSGLNTTDRARLWGANDFFTSGTSPPDVETGRFGFGKAIAINSGANSSEKLVIPVGAQPATGFIGGAMFRYPNTSPDAGLCLQFYDGVANVPHVTVMFAANGVIKVYRGYPTGTDDLELLDNSDPGAFQENEWFHVEVKATIASVGGSVEVRINTVPKVQVVGANTQNVLSDSAYFDCVALYPQTPFLQTTHVSFDDMFVNDTTGAENNDWSGNLRVKTQFMVANGATDNFTIGGTSPAATNWQSVLNQNLDDTKYVYSSTVGNIDLYTPDPNLNSPLVRAVQVRMGLRQDDATQREARAVIRIGSTNYVGTVGQFTNQTFTFYKERWQLNPSTGVSFTGAEVNGLQAGVKLQA